MTRWLYLSIALTVIAIIGTLYAFYGMSDRFPDPVPTHWNIKGEADQYTPKEKVLPYLILTPGIMVLFLGLTVALPYLSPKQFSVDSFRDIYGYIMALAIGLMGLIQVAIVLGSMEIFLAKAKYIVAGLMLFFALMGNVMGKVRRNFWMGVRTPWTLANDNVWNMTHRLTGWLWVGFGLLGLVLVLVIPGESILIVCSVGLLVVVFYPVLYSLILYKRLEREGKL